MSDLPAKILLATDGSEDAALAAQASISLAKATNAELHVVHVGEKHHIYLPRTGGPLPSPQDDEEVKKEHQALLGDGGPQRPVRTASSLASRRPGT